MNQNLFRLIEIRYFSQTACACIELNAFRLLCSINKVFEVLKSMNVVSDSVACEVFCQL